MIGIEIEKYLEYGRILHDLFDGINYCDYSFNIIQREIIEKRNNTCTLLEKNDFKEFMGTTEEYLVIELNLQIFKINKNDCDINDYNDFLHSDCELIMLISDCNFIEMYFKNNELKEIIMRNVKKLELDYIEKRVETDGRKKMEI